MARFRRPRLRRRAGSSEARADERASSGDQEAPEEPGASAGQEGEAGGQSPKPKAKEARRAARESRRDRKPEKAGRRFPWPRRKGRKAAPKAEKAARRAERAARKAEKAAAGAGAASAGGRLARLRNRVPLPRRRPGAARTPGRLRGAAAELWFRVKTRLRVVGYWLREKLQPVGRLVRRAGSWVAGLWTGRSRSGKLRIVAVAAVLAAWALIRFTAVPGVPCELSDAKECAPEDAAVELVPSDALLYAHLTLDDDTTQYERVSDLAESLPNLAALVDQLAASFPTVTGEPLGGVSEVLAWADDDFAYALLPGADGAELPLVVAGVGDKQAAEEFLERLAPAGDPRPADQRGAPLTLYSDDFAAAFAGDELAFGAPAAVREALDLAGGRGEPLDAGAAGVREELPEIRFADVYLSRGGVRRLLAGGGGGSTQLETFVNYGATAGMAAAATAREEGVEVELISALSPELLRRSPTFFSELPEFDPDLAEVAGGRALGFLTVGELGPSLSALLKSPGAEATGLAGALRRLDRDLRSESDVSLLRDLVPALEGQAALVVEPTDAVPIASVVVDGVDSERASRALIALQKPLLRSLGTRAGAASGFVPRFEEREIEGVSASSVRLSPQIELTYALFEDRLVISTQPAGIAAVRSDDPGLSQADPFVTATEPLPDTVSALLFLNLDELLGLAEAAGLAEDPLYASLREDIATVRSIGLAVNAGDEELRSDLFLAIDDE